MGLGPEFWTAVVREKGAHPERLTIVRKARDAEFHIGGKLFVVGDDGEVDDDGDVDGVDEEVVGAGCVVGVGGNAATALVDGAAEPPLQATSP